VGLGGETKCALACKAGNYADGEEKKQSEGSKNDGIIGRKLKEKNYEVGGGRKAASWLFRENPTSFHIRREKEKKMHQIKGKRSESEEGVLASIKKLNWYSKRKR